LTKTERIRVVDFMSDFDHLRHGIISKNEFRRAIKVIFSDLTENHLLLLESKFASSKNPHCVEYLKFSDMIESIFTKKGLQTSPLDEPEVFNVYSNGWEADPFEPNLSVDEDFILKNVMVRLNARIVTRRLDALAFMEDYDFVKEGIY
jgi:hypothetical protein